MVNWVSCVVAIVFIVGGGGVVVAVAADAEMRMRMRMRMGIHTDIRRRRSSHRKLVPICAVAADTVVPARVVVDLIQFPAVLLRRGRALFH